MSASAVQSGVIPFHRPSLGDDEIAAVCECLRGGWLTSGPRVQDFETELARACGRSHAVALSSATAALHLMLRLAGVGEGDEVLTTPFTFVATAEVAFYLGARPVFVDVDDATLNLDPGLLEARIGPRTRAIVPVHFAGQLCDMPAILAVAARHGLAVIEDAAHALSARRAGAQPGERSLGAALSFYATKELALGEGGAIVTDREDIADRARVLSLHGLSRDAWNRYRPGARSVYDVVALGYKMNLPDVLAALGLPQLKRLHAQRARREAIARRYDAAFAGLPGVRPLAVEAGHESARHLYVLRIDAERAGLDRDELAQALGARGIATSVHFTPLFEMSFYRERGYRAEACPVAARAGREVLSLPLYDGLGDDEVESVAAGVRDAVLRRSA